MVDVACGGREEVTGHIELLGEHVRRLDHGVDPRSWCHGLRLGHVEPGAFRQDDHLVASALQHRFDGFSENAASHHRDLPHGSPLFCSLYFRPEIEIDHEAFMKITEFE